MDAISPRHQDNKNTTPNPSLLLPTNAHTCSTNGVQPPPSPLQAPNSLTRSESGCPYPTTFVQADTSSFKHVVQMLTGSSDTAKQASSKPDSKTHIPPIKSIPKKQQQQQQHQHQHQQSSGFKLYERRNSLKNLHISPLIPSFSSGNTCGFSPRKPDILSPSILDFPSLALSPVTPLLPDPFGRSGAPAIDTDAEDRAIKEKGFFLHPSPATTPRDAQPRLLPLFPTTSPRASGSAASSSA